MNHVCIDGSVMLVILAVSNALMDIQSLQMLEYICYFGKSFCSVSGDTMVVCERHYS